MSWDLIVFPAGASQHADENGDMLFPDDWEPAVIGSAEQVRQRIDTVIPGIDWANPNWGTLNKQAYSLEFAVGPEDPQTFMIVAHGEAAAAAIALMSATGWSIYDTGSGKWMTQDDPDEGRRAHQTYIDQVGRRDGEI